MKQNSEKQKSLVEQAYTSYREGVFRFIRSRIDDVDEAEDMTQDVFVRLIEHQQMLSEVTLQSFLFTIARNLVNDFLRRHYKWQEISSYLYDALPTATQEVEQQVIAKDLARCERRYVECLPPQRAKVYILSRYQEKSSAEIAQMMDLALRTVENHLCISRKEVRNYMRQCV